MDIMKKMALTTILGGLVVLALNISSAQAQATRTWVSGVGDDANPCSRTAPCKTFAGAISKTATGGEINCIDPGGFGGLTITKSIQVICLVEAGVLVSGTNAIVVSSSIPANAYVLLEGLDIEGLGTGLNGINILGPGHVTVRRTSIRNFTQQGINVAGPAGTRVLVQDSYITKTTQNGINVAASNTAILEGALIDSDAVGTNVTVAAGGILIAGNSALLGATASVANSGTFISFGDNRLGGTGTPTSTINKR